MYIFATNFVYLFKMKTKRERLSIIERLVRSNIISNQEDLLNLLDKEGFNVTQATLSRDIKQLKIVKSPNTNGTYIYTIPETNIYTESRSREVDEFTSRGFVSIEFSDKLAVVKTRPGYAMGIASDIDDKASNIILGTIAGDDTILLIPREGVNRKEIIKALSLFIPNIKH